MCWDPHWSPSGVARCVLLEFCSSKAHREDGARELDRGGGTCRDCLCRPPLGPRAPAQRGGAGSSLPANGGGDMQGLSLSPPPLLPVGCGGEVATPLLSPYDVWREGSESIPPTHIVRLLPNHHANGGGGQAPGGVHFGVPRLGVHHWGAGENPGMHLDTPTMGCLLMCAVLTPALAHHYALFKLDLGSPFGKGKGPSKH